MGWTRQLLYSHRVIPDTFFVRRTIGDFDVVCTMIGTWPLSVDFTYSYSSSALNPRSTCNSWSRSSGYTKQSNSWFHTGTLDAARSFILPSIKSDGNLIATMQRSASPLPSPSRRKSSSYFEGFNEGTLEKYDYQQYKVRSMA